MLVTICCDLRHIVNTFLDERVPHGRQRVRADYEFPFRLGKVAFCCLFSKQLEEERKAMPNDQVPPPPPGNYGDAKAQAKAANAYAKAQRPWYKKKRWIALIVLVAIIVISQLAGGDSDSDSESGSSKSDGSSNSDGKKSDDPVGTDDNPAPRGTTVANKSAKYTIDDVVLQDSLGDFASPPAGKYVVLTVTVENIKDETIQISSSDFILQVDGSEIDTSSQAYILDNAFSYDDLSPGLKRTGTIVFDVLPKNAGKGVLKAQALFSADDAMYLSLK